MNNDEKAKRDEARGLALFLLGSLFHAAAIAGNKLRSPADSLDVAEDFLQSAERRGIDPARFGS